MPDFSVPGPFAVEIEDDAWQDPARERTLPVRHFRPSGIRPVACVLYSPGLGGSRASSRCWLHHWAGWGIASVILQHPGTDSAALTAGSPLALRHLLRTALDAGQLLTRANDLRFALDCLATTHPSAKIGIAGHSFGAVGALRLLGERRGRDDTAADPEILAAALFSPSARKTDVPLPERFGAIATPCLHLTGSRDDGIGPGDIDAANRCLPFAHIPAPNQYLLVLNEADHRMLAGDAETGGRCAARIKAASTAFWLAHLIDDAAAREYLAAFGDNLGLHDRFEAK